MKAYEILGVAANASADEIRLAYLDQVKRFPPERSPEEFEKIRDAYDSLRDPRRLAKAVLLSPAALAPLASLVDDLKARRIFTGPRLWREVLKGMKSK